MLRRLTGPLEPHWLTPQEQQATKGVDWPRHLGATAELSGIGAWRGHGEGEGAGANEGRRPRLEEELPNAQGQGVTHARGVHEESQAAVQARPAEAWCP